MRRATLLPRGRRALLLAASSGNYASTPSAAAVRITGNQTIIARVAADSYAPSSIQQIFGKWNGTGNQRGIQFCLDGASGKLSINQSTDGTAGTVVSFASSVTLASVGITASSRAWLAATLTTNNGSAGRSCKFYYARDTGRNVPPPFPSGWTQLGTTQTLATALDTFDSSQAAEIGSISGGTLQVFSGRIFYVELRNGYDGAGSVVASFDADAYVSGNVVRSITGETWTVNRSGLNYARITKR